MHKITKLTNGLTLLTEEIPHFESVAFELIIPGGIVCDPPDAIGSSLILSELTTKGAGKYNSVELSNAFDQDGIRHGEGAGHDNYTYRGQATSDKLERALQLVSFMVKEPGLPSDEIESIRHLFLQDIDNLNDNPARRVGIMLSNKYYPEPYSRPAIGYSEGLKNSDSALLTNLWKERFKPDGAVLSVAGKINTEKLTSYCEKIFSDWKGSAVRLPDYAEFPAPFRQHVHDDSAQLQIAMAYPSVNFSQKHYYTAKIANQILSGGMFGRLFIEVREKRGLCYSVYARHSANNHYGLVQAYAGTTPDRASQTLEVMLKELSSLKGTVTEEEINRAKANFKSAVIIGGESPASRASSNATDWWIDKKIRGLDKILQEVDKVTAADIDQYAEEFPSDNFSLLTLGSKNIIN